MPAPEKATLCDLLGLLESIQTNLAARASDPRTKRTLAAIARRSARIAQRLAKPTADSWCAYLEAVVNRTDEDLVKDFLFGSFSCQSDSVGFLEIMSKIVVEHAEFREVKT
jgi:hypothetical protein